eukprot:GILK01002631.1.p1 GENE.GILK01002631.1~~GILK01002631.1.p1  ORF type:complete len:473 (-),score=89.74 GILK01002631.1:709-2127(-)
MTDWSVYSFGARDDTHFDGLHPLAASVCLPVSSTALAAMEKHTLAEKSKKKIGGHMPSMSANRRQQAPLVPTAALNTPTSRGSMKRRAGDEISRDNKRRTLEGGGYSTDDNSTPRYGSDPKELMKGPWTSEEDKQLIDLVNTLGPKNWSQVASHLAKRNGKQCRERYFNHLDPEINKGEWSAEEDKILIDSQARLGNKWSLIAKSLPHRSENQVKNRWNSMMRSHWNRTQKKKGSAANKQDVKAELASRYSSYASTAPVVSTSMRSHSVNLNSSSVLPLVQPPVPAPIQVPVQVEPVASSMSLTTECIASSQMNETSVTIPRWIFDELIQRHLLSLPDQTKDRIVGVIKNLNLVNNQYDGSYLDSDNSYESSPVKEEEEDFYDDESAVMTDDSDTLLAPNAIFSRARSHMHLDPDMVNNSPTGDTPLESPLKRSSCFQFDNVLPTDSIGWYRPMPPMATDPLYDVEFERSYL